MAQKKSIQTSQIIPRDYGLTYKLGEEKYFFSPSKLALATIGLETPAKIRQRLKVKAQKEGMPLKELEEILTTAVQKKDTTKTLLNENPILEAKKYSNHTHGKIQSKSRVEPYDVLIGRQQSTKSSSQILYSSHSCSCPDAFWAEAKNRNVMCIHEAQMMLAIYKDTHPIISTANSLTGLFPRDRQVISLPFNFQNKRLPQLDELVTDVLFYYYVEGKKHYEINRKLLENPQIYSFFLTNAIQSGDDVQFEVLRQKEKQITSDSKHTQEYFAAANALQKRAASMLKQRGFNSTGYSIEFKDSENETVTKRFQNKNEVISLTTTHLTPPMLIRKYLGAKSQNIFGDQNSPQTLVPNTQYVSIDDNTRRESLTQILLPTDPEFNLFVPQIIKNRYSAINSQ